MLSHDLRSAISGVVGSLTQAQQADPSPSIANFLKNASAAAADASRLLDGILDIEAIDQDAFELQLEETRTADFLGDLARRWTDRARSKSITLDIQGDEGLPLEIMIDRTRLSRAIGNLIENAIKYTDHGKVIVSAVKSGEGQITIAVRDTGPGFSDSAMDRLFSYKGRPDDAAKPGSGLGLHIAKSLVDQMGATISVRNDGGAVIEVDLPISLNASATMGRLAVLPSTQLPDLSDVRILLAEDNMTNQAVVTQMLSAMGGQFVVASDGIEALEHFANDTFDLLLLDIEMPRMSGLEVIRHVRSLGGSRSEVPIVALTAYALKEHRERIAEAGADGMIPKPILGIEEFGADLLRHVRRGSENPDMVNGEDPLHNPTFDALAESIGPDLMEELLEKVKIDLSMIKKDLVTGIETGEIEQIRRASHVLISVSGAIGAVGTQHHAESLNRAAHRDDAAEIDRLTSSCLTGIEEILSVISGKAVS